MNDIVRDIHLWLNSFHTTWLDAVMPQYSNLANWFPWVICACLLAYAIYERKPFTWKLCLIPLLAQGIATLIVQPIKYVVNEPRPITFFTEHYPDIQLPLIEGVRMNTWLSFPSGHSATFFALSVSMIILLQQMGKHACSNTIITNKPFRIVVYSLLLLFAIVGGYSRIYLSQHFLHDVLAGAIIGCFAAWTAKKALFCRQ